MNKYDCLGGPMDGGEIETSDRPKAGDLFQDSRNHRYVFSSFLRAWVYVGICSEIGFIRFRGESSCHK